jgi:methylenetetrahydrofolate dehydrogenase (NADP+)/methenyltetrahydrofolate cyclohydrolase
MTAKLVKGTEIREEILAEIKGEVDKIKEEHGAVPGLVTILVGEDPASMSYVTGKIKTAKSLGFKEVQDSQPETISEEELLALVDKYNKDDSIHGKKILNAIDPDKDVDGFHPVNVGRLMIGGSEVKFPPCTPAGIQEMIVRSGVETSGAEVVVVGRSNIVGKPIANMMFQKADGANATVTVVHTRTKDLASHCKRADILINRVGEKISEKTGKKIAILKGDVDFDAAKEIAGWITPVPGGVGPMTITMLMKNTLNSLKFSLGIA